MSGANLIFEIDGQNLDIESAEILNEATGQKEKTYKLKGIFSTIGEKNRNGRVYPRELWEREVKAYQNEIESGSINTLMEFEHPPRTEVDMMQAVAKINKLYIKGNFVMGESVILNNEKSKQLKCLIDNGVKISVSSRGVGTVENGIVTDFKLITYDIVPNPSDFNATMNGICESHENGIHEMYQLNEGILQGKTFGIDKAGNIIPQLTESVSKEELKVSLKKALCSLISEM
jgi:hypothetical protein